MLSTSLECSAAEKTVRLRFAWGSGTAAKQRWVGSITVDRGVLTQLQPLGVEADAPVAMRIDGSRLIVAPLEKRGFDGCDVTVRADEQALVRIELRSEQAPQPTTFEMPLGEVIESQLQQPLDDLGSYFLARRSPGDALRVLPTREHYVFEPAEKWTLKLQPDLASALALGPVLLDVRLRAVGEEKSTWQSSQQISDASQLENSVDFEIECPATEGAYRLTVTARPEEGFATRFVPGQQAKSIASRDVEFVVIDPTAKLPQLANQWLPVLTIDPANPRWWQRLPAWARVPSLRNRNPGSVGNVRPVVRSTPTGELVELPPAPTSGDPYWQSYTLPVREPGQPHLVEIEYPLGAKQHLAISLVEPDAAGRVTSTEQDASLYSEEQSSVTDGKVGVHRFVIWPRTRTPQLLIVNRHSSAPGQFGKIKLMRQDSAMAALAETFVPQKSGRLVAAYLSKPQLTGNFGAAELLDAESGMSVQGWSTFLDGTRRLAQTLRLGGYNGIMLSVSADGSGLYPSRVTNPSPRYDTGLLSASGQDPTRKDVLEMLLRVFDREGLRVVPTVQLAAPLPRLEVLRLGGDSRLTGLDCVGYDGQTYLSRHSTVAGLAPFYNPLNDRVQAEIGELIAELTGRYAQHTSLYGIGIQLSGEGYGVMPGLAWGFDDSTMAEFSRATGVPTASQDAGRFHQRANLLLGGEIERWKQWRQQKLTQLYARLAEQTRSDRSDLQLVLATEDLFAGAELQQRVRQAIANSVDLGQVLQDHSLNLEQLNALPQVTALVPHRLRASESLQTQAIDLRVNAAAEQGELLPHDTSAAKLLYHAQSRFRLPSFDQLSPFGSEQTYLTVTSQPRAAGASHLQQLVTSLAANDAAIIVEGGRQLGLSVDGQSRAVLQALQQLPNAVVEMRTQHQQPIAKRIYRTESETIVTLINEAPWPVPAELTLTGSQPSDWVKLGGSHIDDASLQAGSIATSEQTWQIDLQPHDIQAWRFTDNKLRVGELKTTVSDLVKQSLERRIEAIESRVGNLNIEREYVQLQNPGFELEDGGVRIVGWQPRQGALGSVALDSTSPYSGQRALRLTSDDAMGVAVQSHLFPAPETGQLLASVFLKTEQIDDAAQLQITIQDQNEGKSYRQVASLSSQQLRNKGWSRYEFALTDVPSEVGQQLRLHFHLLGKADILLDDVQMFDLRFDDARRRALVKRIYGAKIALEQGQVVDCLRVVDEYWSRYLVEYVPPTEAYETVAAKPATQSEIPPAAPAEDKKGIGSRLRGWVPGVWR